jgi:ketosteroid isomerase-like protein
MYAWLVGRFLRVAYAQAAVGNTRLVNLLAADDIEFTFAGEGVFGGTYQGKGELNAWLDRWSSLKPQFHVKDVVVSGAPWAMRIAMRFSDTIGDDYANEGVEYVVARGFKVRSIRVFLDTEVVAAWEARHPELTATG